MTSATTDKKSPSTTSGWWWLLAFMAVTLTIYWPGLSGSWLFDDYPNIVDNKGVQPHSATLPSLVNAALSSPSSEFKRPLSSLSFAFNYLASGLDPYGMKLTNLVIHLLNGLLVFLLARMLLVIVRWLPDIAAPTSAHSDSTVVEATPAEWDRYTDIVATLIAGSWMLLPINLTAVLYVVQRMESLANLFVLLGLIGYIAGRRRMLRNEWASGDATGARHYGLWLCTVSLVLPVAVGVLAKETAVMLPLYAFLIEWIVFRFTRAAPTSPAMARDKRIQALFMVVLLLPLLAGLTWLLPEVLKPEAWATRDFTLGTRLLSEARIIIDYIVWTLLPTPHALSFYHDDYPISTGLFSPWRTLTSIILLAILVALMLWLRQRKPLVALGIALFLGCQLLTSTILPLELIYEHRNYFASFGLMLAVIPILALPRSSPLPTPRYALLAGLLICWTALTALTAYAWGDPLRLAIDLATRAPSSPRAEYELGRTYIIYSNYDPASPFTRLAYAPLERAMALPDASILPEQALIFMNARMHLPIKDAWWDSLIAKLNTRKPGVQDESSLAALTQCARDRRCNLPKQRMVDAFLAALSHANPSARLLANYGDYAWNVLGDQALGLNMIENAIKTAPSEPAYRITLVRMLVATGKMDQARNALHALQHLNIGGNLDGSIANLQRRLQAAAQSRMP
jgi:hypothetical protein